MKRLIVLLIIALGFTSCSEYQKVLKEKEILPKYELSNEFYEKGIETGKNKYFRKAIRLFDQILPQYKGKPSGEKVSYMNANAHYLVGDYFLSGYLFERFSKSYPNSEKVEEAFFKSAKSYYEVSPIYSKDQEDTRTAISKLQFYINTYPDGEHFVSANEMIQELSIKIEMKFYEIAKQYHHTERYKAAIQSFDNFILKFPGSKYREKAFFYKFESAYILAINSISSLVPERLAEAKIYYEDYIKYFSGTELSEQAKIYATDIEERTNTLTEL
ncbi:outer membrane protein assembly factor BamD [Psychroflexus lacisalsi]|jgi:outer membrane protein assembly factor BamD|uniref:Outer membrane protein assembly factor BamD n=1 Tax=Psychroflexus lacisalsi TaxID=503928 RepID=A0ABN1K6J8_9FLAO|nr:outer membrane protein assembly factor BamD [Psychroflexus lacisalsi]MBZ9619319.1 outer membrane protein assembly factor BamD [Psychroflexus lacisalsi]